MMPEILTVQRECAKSKDDFSAVIRDYVKNIQFYARISEYTNDE